MVAKCNLICCALLYFFYGGFMKESDYQSKVIKKIEKKFPGALVLKNDPSYKQGIPDLMILYKDKWAALEVKKDEKSRKEPQPNQEYYVNMLNQMSFSSFIYPENEKEVFNALERSFT